MAITKIQTITVGAGGAASIDFTSIPGTYTDLMLVVSARSSRTQPSDNLFVKFNNNTSNLSGRILIGSGSATNSDSSGSVAYNAVGEASSMTANTFGNMTVYIPNYAGATNKSMSTDSVTENNSTESYQTISASLWANTAAITQVTLYWNTGPNFVEYSSATLYGITKGSSGGVTVS